MAAGLLDGRVAVVTGASRGLGEGIATTFAREGAAVALLGRDRERLDANERALRERGATAMAVTADVADAGAVATALGAIIERFERVDVLVNNAAIAPSAQLLEMSDAARDEVIDVNIKGPWNCTRAVLPAMVERGWGRVVNVSSVTGPIVSGPGMAAYSASKGALSGFTRALALEVAEHGITVNAILPGTFDTPMMRDLARRRSEDPEGYLRDLGAGMPLGRLGTLDDAGELAAFLASDRASYITGAEIVIDGGNVIREH